MAPGVGPVIIKGIPDGLAANLAAGDPDKSGTKASAGRPPIHTAMMAAKL
jgi:hypothetical protein